ncbi:MAG: hypothetical protein R3E00_12965 [Paracoccaceae bacterium]
MDVALSRGLLGEHPHQILRVDVQLRRPGAEIRQFAIEHTDLAQHGQGLDPGVQPSFRGKQLLATFGNLGFLEHGIVSHLPEPAILRRGNIDIPDLLLNLGMFFFQGRETRRARPLAVERIGLFPDIVEHIGKLADPGRRRKQQASDIALGPGDFFATLFDGQIVQTQEVAVVLLGKATEMGLQRAVGQFLAMGIPQRRIAGRKPRKGRFSAVDIQKAGNPKVLALV